MRALVAACVVSAAIVGLGPVSASAQDAAPPAAAPALDGSRLWIVVGGGFSAARASCATCDRDGVFHRSKSLLIDAGIRVNEKVDAGVELFWVSSRIEKEDPVRTTFVLALAQIRPWHTQGFFMRAGMGIAFAGTGIYNPIGPALDFPYSTNALGIAYGAGWVFKPHRCWTVQVQGTHHVAAIGELTTTDGSTIRNVIGNYWTAGVAIVLR
jgi:hypothetical protein